MTTKLDPVQKDANMRARKGAKYMDKVRPNWHNEVSPDTLEMGNPYVCILGQTFSDYLVGLYGLRLSDAEAGELGFTIYNADPETELLEFTCLTHGWQNELMKRRETA